MLHIEPQPIKTAYINPSLITAICKTEDNATLIRTVDGKTYRSDDTDIHNVVNKTKKAVSEGRILELYA